MADGILTNMSSAYDNPKSCDAISSPHDGFYNKQIFHLGPLQPRNLPHTSLPIDDSIANPNNPVFFSWSDTDTNVAFVRGYLDAMVVAERHGSVVLIDIDPARSYKDYPTDSTGSSESQVLPLHSTIFKTIFSVLRERKIPAVSFSSRLGIRRRLVHSQWCRYFLDCRRNQSAPCSINTGLDMRHSHLKAKPYWTTRCCISCYPSILKDCLSDYSKALGWVFTNKGFNVTSQALSYGLPLYVSAFSKADLAERSQLS